MCVYVYRNPFAIHQKLTQHCKSTVLQKTNCAAGGDGAVTSCSSDAPTEQRWGHGLLITWLPGPLTPSKGCPIDFSLLTSLYNIKFKPKRKPCVTSWNQSFLKISGLFVRQAGRTGEKPVPPCSPGNPTEPGTAGAGGLQGWGHAREGCHALSTAALAAPCRPANQPTCTGFRGFQSLNENCPTSGGLFAIRSRRLSQGPVGKVRAVKSISHCFPKWMLTLPF